MGQEQQAAPERAAPKQPVLGPSDPGPPAPHRPAPDRPAPDRPALRLLHTADVHLDDSPGRDRAFAAVVDAAIEQAVDAVLVAGDLFDHARVDAATVDGALGQLARLRCPVAVVPGNHDCLDESSLWRRVDLRAAGPHVLFFDDPDGRWVRLDRLGLALWGRGIGHHLPTFRPLAAYRPAHPDCWRVVVTHGHHVPAGGDDGRSSPITEEELAALDCHYVALGHWHRYVDVSVAGVVACYPGAPTDDNADEPTVNLVTLGPAGVGVDRLGVPRREG